MSSEELGMPLCWMTAPPRLLITFAMVWRASTTEVWLALEVLAFGRPSLGLELRAGKEYLSRSAASTISAVGQI
jgi:hypothetical protein